MILDHQNQKKKKVKPAKNSLGLWGHFPGRNFENIDIRVHSRRYSKFSTKKNLRNNRDDRDANRDDRDDRDANRNEPVAIVAIALRSS